MLVAVKKIGTSYGLPREIQEIICDMLYLYYWKDRMRRINSQYHMTWCYDINYLRRTGRANFSSAVNWRNKYEICTDAIFSWLRIPPYGPFRCVARLPVNY